MLGQKWSGGISVFVESLPTGFTIDGNDAKLFIFEERQEPGGEVLPKFLKGESSKFNSLPNKQNNALTVWTIMSYDLLHFLHFYTAYSLYRIP